MTIPPIAYAAFFAQAVPILACLRHKGRLPPARWWIVLFLALLLVYDGLSLWTALQGIENLWTGYVFGPLEVGSALMALSFWQETQRARSAFRGAILIFALVWLALVVVVEDTSTWSIVTGPLLGIVILVASLYTLLTRIGHQVGGLVREDWYWICVGLALKYGASPGVDPLARLLAPTAPDIVFTAYQIKSSIDIIACLVIAGGILCPIPPRRPFSGPSPPASSPSRSFSPRSAPP